MSTPTDRRYAKTHEWVKIEGAGATVGISDHAQEALGDVTFVELPKVGRPVKGGESCGVVESVKAASDIYAPVSGRVSAVNQVIETAPQGLNGDPYGAGWLFKLSDVTSAEAAGLMDAAAYDAFVEGQG